MLVAELKRIGMENSRIIETKGHPLVYADWLHAAGKPTVLMYGHYDVQPPDPLDEWHSPPFEPTERDGNIYARGAVDDKGQMCMHVKALESLLSPPASFPSMCAYCLRARRKSAARESRTSWLQNRPNSSLILHWYPIPSYSHPACLLCA